MSLITTRTVHRGKILRIDVNVGTGPYEYGIPPDNPFLDNPDVLPEIYAYGIRNPYKISIDQGDRNTGKIYQFKQKISSIISLLIVQINRIKHSYQSCDREL